jgi:enoyl-CoA hydratase
VPNNSYSDFEHLSFERPRSGVLLVTLNRPDVLNAANVAMHREMSDIWSVIDDDDEVAVTVVTGAGRAFSAGGDLSMIEEMTRDYEALLVQWRDAGAIVERMLDARKPVVSAINGVAVGAGLAVALLADVSIAAESAKLSDGHVRIGVAAGDHAALLWPMLCGFARAKYYLLTADFVDGREAERIGLVSRCVPDDRVIGEALDVAERLAQGSATAIQWTRRVLNQHMRQNLPLFGESLALEMLGFLGPDAREGVAALRERRPPNFAPRGGDRGDAV